MPDLWLDVDAALAEVPVNILALIDSIDFVTREVAVAYNQAGMDLVWNFVTTAGATTQTAVTPTTAGVHDWAHQGDGMYSIEIPASGGTINNDTEGFGWFTGYCTGVLPWRGPTIGFRAAALNNLLIDAAYSATRGLAGTALPNAAADAAGGVPISDAGELDLDTQLGTDIDAILTDTAVIGALGAGLTAVPWNADWDAEVQSEVQDAIEANNLDHLAKVATAGADMTTEVIDNSILSRILANGDTSAFVPSTDGLQLIRDKQTDIEADTNELQGDWTNAGRLDALIDLILADTGELQTDWANAGRLDALIDLILADTGELQGDDVPGLISTHDGKLDTVDGIVDNILADTGELQTDWADAGRLDALIDLILGDTNELQTDWVNAGRLDAILDLILADTAELQTDDVPGAISTHDGKLDTVDGIVDNILTDTAVIGALGVGLTAVPWNSDWDAEVQSEVADALDAAVPGAPTADSINERIETMDDLVIYQAKLWVYDDEANATDRYACVWFLNGVPVVSGITSPQIQVIKMADGSDLVGVTGMSQAAATGLYRYDEGTDRIVSGVAYMAKVTATIGGSTRTWYQPVGRDSSA